MSLIKWWIHGVLGYPNYTIRSIEATYEVTGEPTGRALPFWNMQALEKGTLKTVNVRGWTWKPVPNFIHIHTILIHYWYNGTVYTWIPPTLDFVWPPVRGPMRFNLPVQTVTLEDEDGRIVVDITGVVKRFMGPMSDTSIVYRVKRVVLTNVLGIRLCGEIKF